MGPSTEPTGHTEYLTGRRRVLGFVALLVFLLAGIALRMTEDASWPAVLAALVAIAASAGLLRATARGVLGCSIAVAGAVAVIGHGSSSNLGWFALCILVGWCILGAGRATGSVFWAGSLLLLAGEWLWADRDNGWGAWAAGVSFTALGALLVRHEFILTTQLSAAQAGLAERSRQDERTRIARELHDVIAHCLTVSLLHVSSARLAVEYDDRAEAARALDEAERLGRQSLDEVRTTMGLLRTAGPTGSSEMPAAAPAPGLTDVVGLVEQFTRAGLHVDASIEGDPSQAAATTGSVLYRIAQESLTNAARHAPGAAITLRMTIDARNSSLSVESDGVPRPVRGPGLGLIGMRERAESVGGTCTSGPTATGWRVHAVLPAAPTPR
jgi:signal transduction histidine kinase